jgi:hypothetical protein
MKIFDWLAFRTTKRYNILKIRDLSPNYWDKDTILLYAVMQIVVDFVEVECAFMELDTPQITFWQRINMKLPWWLRSDEAYRNRESGLKHLTLLEDMYQDMLINPSDAPKAIREVYLWWKNVRPFRQDPGDESGFNAYVLECKNANKKEDKKHTLKLLKKTVRIEQHREKEDTEMLNKVIKYRGFMWT